MVGLTDASGNLVARYAYDPYGQTVVKQGSDSNPTSTAVADGNPFRYSGVYLDTTGLYKLGARYYDPAKGRFTQLDPAGTGYVYSHDDPINFADPSGLEDCEENPSTGSCSGVPLGEDNADPDGPYGRNTAYYVPQLTASQRYAAQQLQVPRDTVKSAVEYIKQSRGCYELSGKAR